MASDKKVIEYLNGGLKKELTAINQYFLHSRLAYDWGFDKLGAKEYEESIEEMQHADQFMQRILFLGGLPNLQELEKLKVGENVREMLEADLAGEHDSLAYYREAAAYCESVQDYASRDLFTSLIADEEGHADWLETQIKLMDQLGEASYLQMQMVAANEGEGDGEG
ncbi:MULTISPECIES: bacterioferritin [unclassified Halorhodospira]|uniref:bacterioferritin n=1 Tax=unclassified Halorhodospira TaxID=2626748 RepID=UPI001EE86BE4|nr:MULTISPECIES: bacterioferritin [unclassified Halorhodospira]MCG5541778.1 bacterioferritin [Halorhodospira sp. M39old]MCG5546859.1 bacterioferritin [Halorhodospira sp. M38]